MPNVVHVIGVEQNARPIAHARDGRLNFVALHLLIEEIQRRRPEENGQEKKDDGVTREVFTMDNFHEDVIG